MIPAQPSRTALRVALRRAAHQLHDAPPLVFPDPLAVPILGPAYKEELARTPNSVRRPFSAAIRAFMVARARLAEDALAHAYSRHNVRQYLILGAGLDTLAYRNPHPHLRVFEVDHPATQAWKRDLLTAANIPIPATTTHVPVDFECDSLPQQLAAAGFDPHAPTTTAWLGVVPYLTLEAFRATTRFLGTFPQHSSVVFDYSLPREALSTTERLMLDSMSARVAQVGEPFQLFFTPEQLQRELSAANLAVLEDLDGPAVTNRLFAHRTDGLQLRGRAGHICHAAVSFALPKRA